MAEQRYRVIDRLEAGGMAEVYLGEAASVQGFKKRVAIKRVLPHLAQNKKFITMFLDEARLGARLNHANIVSLFDIGAADNTYFIVMEFVDGANLKTIMEQIRTLGNPFPVKESIFICMEACRGLSYAHELLDDTGESLNIVHRDVSPPNIIISKRGEVKVADFGLAKATTQLEKTDPGVVKGKFSYLSPEAVNGDAVDARADVFAMGIVLWEMLGGRRLFLGETDYKTIQQIQKAQIPSLEGIHPEWTPELDALIAKALDVNPKNRFQSARDFGDALTGYLFDHRLKVTSYDVANVVKSALEAKVKASIGDPPPPSNIDRLIKEELLRFTSLDDMESGDPMKPGSQPIDAEALMGAQPLDASFFSTEASSQFSVVDELIAEAEDSDEESDEDSENWDEDNAGELANLLEPSASPISVGPSVSLDTATGSVADRATLRTALEVPSLSPSGISEAAPAPAVWKNWRFIAPTLLVFGAGFFAWLMLSGRF